MKLTIARQDLARVLTNVGRVVEARTTIPILSNVKLSAVLGQLRVTGTDLDIVATDAAPAEVTAEGDICVSAKLLADIAKKAGGDVTMSLDGGKLVVTSGKSKFSLQTLPADTFPDLAEGKYDATFEIDLAALFAPTTFAISTEETRWYLNGVFFKGDGSKFTAVATDGHRLSKHVRDVGEDTFDSFTGIIVPRKTVSVLPKSTVNLSVSDSKIRVVAGDFVLVSKLVDGTFPDYERVIPKDNDLVVTVDRDALLKASDRVATISGERGKAVKLSISPGLIKLTVSNPENGDAEDEVPAECNGEPVDIGFNAAYLRELLSVLPSGEVKLSLRDGGSPTVVTGGAEALTLVLMPMRV